MTYILDTIDNQFASGTLDAISNVNTSDWNDNFGTGFTATKPYKMRGRYGNGIDTGVYIPLLNLHHTFTVSTWIYADSTTGTLFSKDKGSYTTLDSENLLNLEISAGQLSAKLYTGSTDNFGGSCITTSSVVSAQVWVSVSYVFTFNGEGTDVDIYTNASSVLSYNSDEIFLEDKDTYRNAFLMAASTYSSGNTSPENVFQGYMYRFCLWYSVEYSLIEDEVDVLSNCANCSHVTSLPTHCAANAGSDNTSQCLWDAVREDWIDNNTEVDCLSACGNDGCVRDEDCNRCDDRKCEICTNFDSQYTICTQCITNASKANSNDPCTCNDQYGFNELTDECEICGNGCATCTIIDANAATNKYCDSCLSGFFLQENVNTCLDFCPSNFTEGATCSSSSGTDMFCLTFAQSAQWSSDFRYLIESVNSRVVLRGETDSYSTDDPWLHRSLDNRYSVFFDGSDDLLEIQEISSGYGGLLMTHTMTIQVWAKRTAVDGTSLTLLSKVDDTKTENDVQKFVLGSNGNNLYVDFQETDKNDVINNFLTTGDTTDAQIDGDWFLVSVTFDLNLTTTLDTDVTIYKNSGILAKTQTHNEQFSDVKGSRGIIGALMTEAGSSLVNSQFFQGYLYSVCVHSYAMTSTQVENSYSTADLPANFSTCDHDEYDYNSQCYDCDQTCSETDSTCTYQASQCTWCDSARCIQCSSSSNCSQCASSAEDLGSGCVCKDSFYEHTVGRCEPCHTSCAKCTAPSYTYCQACTGDYSLMPNSYTCEATCPMGYTKVDSGDGNVCTLTGNNSVAYLFTFLTHVFTSNTVTFNAGQDDSAEPLNDPFTYKLRGLYMDGNNNLMTYDRLGSFYLHNQLTVYTWILPTQASGCIFTKSKNDFTDSSSSKFFDISIGANDTVSIEITHQEEDPYGNSVITTFSDAYDLNDWNHIGIIISYDKDTRQSTFNLVHNQSILSAQIVDEIFILDLDGSWGAIGARYDGSSGTTSVVNHFQGFIYSINVEMGLQTTSTIQGYVTSSGCQDGTCSICPTATTTCLWTCAIDQYAINSTCTACPTCPTQHPTDWDGCVRAENCNVCFDDQCSRCTNFDQGSCSDCITDANTKTACVCDDFNYYSDSQHACLPCSTNCADCFGDTKYECTNCRSGFYIWDESYFCLSFCPTYFLETTIDNSCTPENSTDSLVLHAIFNEVDIDVRNQANTKPLFVQDVTDLRPTPVKSRGHYFDGTTFWKVEAPASSPDDKFIFNSRHTIVAWTKVMNVANETTIFSKSKAVAGTSTNSDDDNMLAFYVTTQSKLAYRLDNGSVSINYSESDLTLNLNSWDYVAVVSQYSKTNNETKVDIIINTLTYYTISHADTYMIEHLDSLTSVGQQYETNTNGEFQASRFLNGFIYTLWVYNDGLDPTTLQAEAIDNSTSNQQCSGGCTYCPQDTSTEGTCISVCALGTFDDACIDCPSGCDENCVSEVSWCELCDNPLCSKCETFVEQTCFECSDNAELNTAGNDCSCMVGFAVNADATSLCLPCGLFCAVCTVGGSTTYNECTACQTGYYNISRDGNTYCSPSCPTGSFAFSGDICTPLDDPAAILSYTFIDSFDAYTNDISGISNNAIAVNSNGSGLPGTHRGLYFNGSSNAKVSWENDFVLGLSFSVHSWVYAFDQANRTSDMTLFSKTETVAASASQEWHDHLALRVDTALNFKVNLGYDSSTQSYTSLSSSADVLVENTWTYVTYYLYMTNSNQVNVQMYINSVLNGSVSTLIENRILLFDDPTYVPCLGSEHLQADSPFNQWNGYIYDVHIFQALGDMQYQTISCDDNCAQCPLNLDCLWAVDWDAYDNGTCESTCDNIGCRRDGRCQDCTFQHCHMCADYYCEQCSDHSSDSCSSCLSAAVNGSNGSCVCGIDLWGNQFSRSDIEKPCCAAGCDTCSDEVDYAHCSVCNSSSYEQPAVTTVQEEFKVCFDECPTGFTATEGPPRTCTGEGRRIIDYDLTYIERDFANLAIDGQNVGQQASVIGSGFADTLPYKLRGAYGNGSNQGVYIPSLHLHHSFSVSFWAKLTGTMDQERVLFSKDKGGGYDTPNAENFLDVAVLNNGRLAAFLYQNADDKFEGDCATSELAVIADAWYYIVYTFEFDGTDTIVTIYVDSINIFSYTAQTLYIQDKSSYSQAWLFMSTASSFDDPAPANAWEGFIYRFQLDQYVITPNEISLGIETDGSQCTPNTITCSKCPTVNGSQCLWTVDRDSYVDSLGNTNECDDSNDHEDPLCLNDVGCVRREDCNRCNDRLCQTCINFDEGLEICEVCTTNADNNQGTTVCQCSDQYFFDERSDTCEECNVACDECADFGDKTAKSCAACEAGYFLHPDSNTCLDFCPTGFATNGLVCDRGSDNTML